MLIAGEHDSRPKISRHDVRSNRRVSTSAKNKAIELPLFLEHKRSGSIAEHLARPGSRYQAPFIHDHPIHDRVLYSLRIQVVIYAL